jgi:hypothetical protein
LHCGPQGPAAEEGAASRSVPRRPAGRPTGSPA